MVLCVCTDFSALAANVNNNNDINNKLSHELQLPDSTKGFIVGGWTCTLCIEGFMESFYLFSYCILTVTHIKKIILKRFFPPPPQIVFEIHSINGIIFSFSLYFLASHDS